jgi:hypothetical protein
MVPRCVLVAVALACLAFAGVLYVGVAGHWGSAVSGARSRGWSREGLLSLPSASQGPVSAALGHDQAAYRISGLVAHNQAQHLSAQFGRSGVSITTGSTRFAISLKGFGRGQALRALAPVAPVVSANRVSYARGSVREWWANGPLGLEQGFDVARRPAGSGALTLSLAVPTGARLDHGVVSLPGGLRYAGVHATGAGGRVLRSWLEVRGGHVFVRVDDRGAKYPVGVDPYVQQAELSASGAGSDELLGYSVAVAGDTAVVGAPHQKYPQPENSSTDPYPGAVYVFELGGSGWSQVARLTAPDGDANGLGWSVGISESGTTIVAGAPGPPSVSNPCGTTEGNMDPGQAYVYAMPSGGWSNMTSATATLTAGDACPGDGFGWSVGISGSTVVVGAPWGPTVPDENEPGYPPVPEQGEVYEYTMPSGGWKSMIQTAELTANNPGGEDVHLGWSVAVSGGTIVAGDPEGRPEGAYVFVKPAGEWTSAHQTAELTASNNISGEDAFGKSVAISGNTIAVGSPFQKVGASSQGAAYVFVMPSGGWANKTESAELTATDGSAPDELGYSVGVSGATVVAGARKHEVTEYADQGAAYVFTEPSGGWSGSQTQAQELTASDASTLDSLGESVAISGNTILAGAPRHLATGGAEPNEAGAAYIFGLGTESNEGSTGGGTTSTGTGTTTTSGGMTSPPPPPPPAARVVSISGGHAKITVVLSCPSGTAACSPVSLNAMLKEHLKGKSIVAISAGATQARVKTKQVRVSIGGATLAEGSTETLTLKLNATGRALLKKFGKLEVAVTATSAGKTIGTGIVKVRRK